MVQFSIPEGNNLRKAPNPPQAPQQKWQATAPGVCPWISVCVCVLLTVHNVYALTCAEDKFQVRVIHVMSLEL